MGKFPFERQNVAINVVTNEYVVEEELNHHHQYHQLIPKAGEGVKRFVKTITSKCKCIKKLI